MNTEDLIVLLSLFLSLVASALRRSACSAGPTCPCGQSQSTPAASCLGAFLFCGFAQRTLWVQPGPGVPAYQVGERAIYAITSAPHSTSTDSVPSVLQAYCGASGTTLAMLIECVFTRTRCIVCPHD
jgi:hypothetical protein